MIAGAMPGWFAPVSTGGQAILGHAVVPADNGVGATVADLRIEAINGVMEIAETTPGTTFPADCPERHINDDGSFCVGYGAGTSILSHEDAVVWWGLVEEYLRLQRVAARTRMWPARKAISHGRAGQHHVRALEAARALGLEEDFYEMLEGEPKWFSGSFPRLSADGDRLLNGRLPCPNGCLRKGREIIRRDCRQKRWVVQLVREERRRREAERQFAEANRIAKLDCCGTMKNCPRARSTEAKTEARDTGWKSRRI